MLACNCLNVIIETETNDFQKVTADSLNLTEEEKNDDFFKQNILRVGKLTKINKIHAGLIKSRIIGSWIVYQCINCSVHAHAIHRDRGAACVLVASKLLNLNAIKELRNSDMYSTIFNVVVNSNQLDFEENRKVDNYLPNEVETTIKGLKQVVSDEVKREVLATEEKIRKFTEEQYHALENFRDKAFREQEALTRRVILSNSIKKPDYNSSTNKEMSMQKSEYKPSAENVPIKSKNKNSPVVKTKHKVISNSSFSNKRLTTSRTVTQTNSLDAEGLFDFDGIDEVRTPSHSEIEESDSEESGMKDESVKSHRNQDQAANLAKSLPMDIPAFMSFHNHLNEDQEDSFAHPEDPLDIAASIKALAKSVHGDTVFGDLPRPRFSTQI